MKSRPLPHNLFSSLVLFLLGFGTSYAALQSTPIPLSERVLVVYNTNVPASQEVADYYLSKRGIPAANKCAITPSDAASVDWTDFATNVRAPIRACINAIGKDRILYIVFTWQFTMFPPQQAVKSEPWILSSRMFGMTRCWMSQKSPIIPTSPPHKVRGMCIRRSFRSPITAINRAQS